MLRFLETRVKLTERLKAMIADHNPSPNLYDMSQRRSVTKSRRIRERFPPSQWLTKLRPKRTKYDKMKRRIKAAMPNS